jgi:hypothetical protein
MDHAMSSRAHQEEGESVPISTWEDGITINYWRMGQEGILDHYGLHISVQVSQHRITWTMNMHPQTAQEIFIDGRTIALVAGKRDIGINTLGGSEHEHLGLITLSDNDQPHSI